jgi:hypothetical protein
MSRGPYEARPASVIAKDGFLVGKSNCDEVIKLALKSLVGLLPS